MKKAFLKVFPIWKQSSWITLTEDWLVTMVFGTHFLAIEIAREIALFKTSLLPVKFFSQELIAVFRDGKAGTFLVLWADSNNSFKTSTRTNVLLYVVLRKFIAWKGKNSFVKSCTKPGIHSCTYWQDWRCHSTHLALMLESATVRQPHLDFWELKLFLKMWSAITQWSDVFRVSKLSLGGGIRNRLEHQEVM